MKPNKSKRNLERVHTVLEKYQSPQKTKGAYLTYLFHGAGYYLKSCHSACQKISRLLMEPEGSLPSSQKPVNEPYSEPGESSSLHRSLSP
jgi:hypothetical protein